MAFEKNCVGSKCETRKDHAEIKKNGKPIITDQK